MHILGQKALADAGIPYSAIQQACVGYVYGKTLLLNLQNPKYPKYFQLDIVRSSMKLHIYVLHSVLYKNDIL